MNESSNAVALTGLFTDSRDGNQYKWIKIGTQIWMAENLRYLPETMLCKNSNYETELKSLDNRCDPNIKFGSDIFIYGYLGKNPNEAIQTENFDKYGCLYFQSAGDQCCPSGWVIPNLEDWKILRNFVNSVGEQNTDLENNDLSGKYLKSMLFDGNNTCGFNALPSGARKTDGKFYGLNDSCNFMCSSSEIDKTFSWVMHDGGHVSPWGSFYNNICLERGIDSLGFAITQSDGSSSHALSIRCLFNFNCINCEIGLENQEELCKACREIRE